MYFDWESCEKDRESYTTSLYRCINECKPSKPWIFRKQAEAERRKLTAGLFKSLSKSKIQIWKPKTYPQLYSRVINDLIGMKSIWETCNQVRNIYWGLLNKCWDQCGGKPEQPPFVDNIPSYIVILSRHLLCLRRLSLPCAYAA